MPFDALVHDALWRELPRDEHEGARVAMRAIVKLDQPARSPQVGSLSGSAHAGSYRLRVGRYRILFILFPDERTLAFMTGFLKRRESDYDEAIELHDARVRSYE